MTDAGDWLLLVVDDRHDRFPRPPGSQIWYSGTVSFQEVAAGVLMTNMVARSGHPNFGALLR
jgi:hypothetical protein